jgi:hypothetical protein
MNGMEAKDDEDVSADKGGKEGGKGETGREK